MEIVNEPPVPPGLCYRPLAWDTHFEIRALTDSMIKVGEGWLLIRLLRLWWWYWHFHMRIEGALFFPRIFGVRLDLLTMYYCV